MNETLAIASGIPEADLDELDTDGVSRWFNSLRAPALYALSEGGKEYCAAREAGASAAMQAALDRMYWGFCDLRDINRWHREYNESRRRRGLHRPALSQLRGDALLRAKAHRERAQARALEKVAHQLRSRPVVGIDTGNVEYRLKGQRWRERSKR